MARLLSGSATLSGLAHTAGATLSAINALGITTLGTVTAGTLGSGVTFPAGHVLQSIMNTEDTLAASSDNTWMPAVAHSITISNATNKILAIGTAQGEIARSGATGHGGIRIKTTSSGTDEIADYNVTDGSGPYSITGYDRMGFNYVITNIFSPEYSGTVTVTVEGRRYASSSTMTLNTNSTTHSESQLLLMEIAYG